MKNEREKQLYLELLDSIITVDQSRALLNSLSELESKLFHFPQSPADSVESVLGYHMSQEIAALCQVKSLDRSNVQSYQKIISELRSSLASLQTVSLILGFEPSSKQIQNISDWFVVNLKKKVLLEIHVDRSIVGGAIVVQNGRYKDLSLKSKIEARYGKNNLSSLAWT